jgi:hypothetical protein
MGGCNWTITSAFDEQYFTTIGKTIFEGVAHISGSCGNEPSSGTAWLEQALFEKTPAGAGFSPTLPPAIKVSSEGPTSHPSATSSSPTVYKNKQSKSLKQKGKKQRQLKKKHKGHKRTNFPN